MKLSKPVTHADEKEVRELLSNEIADSKVQQPALFLIKHRKETAGAIAIEINNSVALIHAVAIKESYNTERYAQKLMGAVSLRMAYMGVRSLYVLTQRKDIFYYNSHFAPVEDTRLPETYRPYYQSKFGDCEPRVFYKHLPNPWPSNPFR